MKFKVKPNVLPKNIKILQKYIEESESDSYDESSYESDYSSYDSSKEYTTSSGSEDGSSTTESCDDSEYSFDSVSTSERNFTDFLKEYSKKRVYSIKNDPLMVDYIFTSNRVGGKWKRHLDKSIVMYYQYLNTDKESIKNGDPLIIKVKLFDNTLKKI